MTNLRLRVASLLSISPVLLATVVGVCFLAASLSARFFVVHPEIVAPVWPSAGVLMFALLRTTERRAALLAIAAAFIAGLAANVLTSVPVVPSLIFSLVNCVGAVVGGELLKRQIGPAGRFNNVRNLAMLVVYGAGVANAVGATCGAAIVAAFHLGAFGPAWVTWWLSNALGILIVMPLASEALDLGLTGWRARLRIAVEVAVLLALSAVVITFGFGLPSTAIGTVAPLLVFPALVWVGLRFNIAVAAIASFVVTLLTLFLSVRGLWVFAANEHALHARIVQLQVFMIIAVISSLVPAVALAERRRAEESLRESEQSLRTLFDTVYDGILIHDLEGRLLDVNQRCLAMYGIRGEQLADLTVRELSGLSAPVERLKSVWAEVMAERPQFFEWKARRPDEGTEFDVEVFLRRIRMKGRDVIMANIRDITARKRAELALRESEGRLRMFIEHAPAAIAMLDCDMRYVAASRRWLEDYHLSGNIVGRCHYELFPELPERWKELHRRALAGEVLSAHDDAFPRTHGSTQWLKWEIRPWQTDAGKIGGILIATEDVTSQVQIQEALRESEVRYRTLFESIDEAFCIVEVIFDESEKPVDYRFLQTNPSFAKQTGLYGAVGKTMREFAPKHEEYWFEIFGRVALTGEPIRFQNRARELGGRWYDVYAFRTGDPQLRQVAILFDDITGHKQTLDALRDSESHLRTIAENIPQMIWVTDDTTTFHYLSPKWLEYTGAGFEENQHGRWVQFLHPDDFKVTFELWQRAIDTRGVYEAEYRLRRYDGEYRWHLARAVPIVDAADGKMLWFGTTTDIEDQKRTHLALIRSEKLAATGRLASSMAHEINNPLAAALNSLYLALLDDTVVDSTRQHIDLAQRELERVAHITRQTLGFYRETGKPTKVDLCKVADSVVDLYGPRLKNKDIYVEREYRSEATVFAIEGEVRQILANLFSNSIDAVESHGCIRLRIAGPLSFDGGRPAVRLSVSDNGSGIDPQHLSHIFEPFFSTKEATGTGLGLWVTQQLVKKHQGKIRARSTPGKLTVFEVYLPLERRNPERLEQDVVTTPDRST